MNGMRLFFVAALSLAILGCASTGGEAAGQASPARASVHRILVMLHMPPPHFQPNADYAGGYGMDPGRGARRRVAAALAREYGLALGSDWPMPAIGLDCFVMEGAPDRSPERIAEALSRDPRVEWAQPNRLFHAMGGNDPLYPLQPGARLWHLSAIHAMSTGRNVRIAVVDSGIEAKHPDLAGQIAIEENFVDGSPYAAEMHGTAIAGIIAARAGNGIGIAGIAPNARLLAMRACWEEAAGVTACNSFTLGKALHSAILHGAHIINLSLAGPSDPLVARLLDEALNRHIKVIAAADPHSEDGGFPASHAGVLAVTDEFLRTDTANGARMLIAPGRDVPATLPGGRWGFVSGPSFSAAHVSGLVALITELQPALLPAQLRHVMVMLPPRPGAAASLDACATFMRLARTCSCSCLEPHAAANAHP